ncbi:head GIN domain-containing protein [Rufibacter aurantiacus]|uniref:head GIN domain-containing protein n=1 Tax=Rufibacter aurantiacus TaxID=2817374 RepID=UPI0024A6F070|nr:head GIN domain-containing protein [Rufibacter aurantiacus]
MAQVASNSYHLPSIVNSTILSKGIYSLWVCFYVFVFTSCDILGNGPCQKGTGETKTEARDVASFKAVDMRIGGNVHVSAGSKVSVSVQSFANLLPEIMTEVEGNTLVIRSESCLDYADEETNIFITLPDITGAELKSSGQMRIQTVPSSGLLTIHLAGSGSIRYIGSADRINVQNSGSGIVDLEGFVNNLETTLTGSGSIQGYFLHADTAKTKTTGSGFQQIWVDKTLDATITGSGSIYYRGYPHLISTFTSGSGKVINDN